LSGTVIVGGVLSPGALVVPGTLGVAEGLLALLASPAAAGGAPFAVVFDAHPARTTRSTAAPVRVFTRGFIAPLSLAARSLLVGRGRRAAGSLVAPVSLRTARERLGNG
jgi:hypothetical protein